MRSFKPSLTPELQKHNAENDSSKAPAYPIRTYRQLVEQVAHLSFLNKEQLLFFRGQGKDHKNKAGASTFYPPIYRGEYVTAAEIRERFRVLDECCKQLKVIFEAEGFEGAEEVSRREYVQWSILQHYQVCDTPLLDITHSLRVACSFAEMHASGSASFVYVFGLPYLTNRISINSEHDIVNVRLLSICPPQALRPYFQEGYLCGTTDIRDEYRYKGELDFKRRLIAKFRIKPSARFWGRGFQMIPKSVLFPSGDDVEKACQSILPSAFRELYSDDLGNFIHEWSILERKLLSRTTDFDASVHSARQAIETLERNHLLPSELASSLEAIRVLQNQAIHSPETIKPNRIAHMRTKMRDLRAFVETL